MEKLTFFDLKAKKKFESEDYTIETKNGRSFAKTTAPSGCKVCRIVKTKKE